MATIIPLSTVPTGTSSVNSTPKNGRQLLKNIKNLPVSASKKNSNVTTVVSSATKNAKAMIKNKDQLLFTSSSDYSVISKDNHLQESNLSEPSPSPFKELRTADLEEDDVVIKPSEDFVMVDDAAAAVVVAVPDATNVTKSEALATKTSRITYSIDFLKSMQHKNTLPRPKEIDIIEESQKEAALLQSTNSVYSSVHRTPMSSLNGYQQTPSSLYKSANSATPYKNHPMSIPVSTSPFSIQQFASPKLAPITMSLRPQPLPLPVLPLPTPMIQPLIINTTNNNNNSFRINKKQKPTTKQQNKEQVKSNSTDNNNSSTTTTTTTTTTVTDGTEQLVKGMEKVLKETNTVRLEARQRQINIGKSTVGYTQYLSTVSKNKRKKTDPKTPNKNQICSKRSWDGQMRKWRRLLHQYDPTGEPIDINDMEDDVLEDVEEDIEDVQETTNETPVNNNNNSQQIEYISIPQPSSIYDNISPLMAMDTK